MEEGTAVTVEGCHVTVGNLMRASVLRERKACAALIRSVMAEQRLADLGELLAKNIEARP